VLDHLELHGPQRGGGEDVLSPGALWLERRLVLRSAEIVAAIVMAGTIATFYLLERLHAVEFCAQRLAPLLAQDVVGIAVVLHGLVLRKRISMFSSSFATKIARSVTSSHEHGAVRHHRYRRRCSRIRAWLAR